MKRILSLFFVFLLLLSQMPAVTLHATTATTHIHSYTATLTAPTCTEQGYTTYNCDCGDSYVDDYVDATGHKRTNGICSVCGDSFAGKKVSILSHSMSTYAGISNNTSYNSTIGKNDVYYTEGRHGVYLKDTWWMQTIDALGMELLVNNSWSGSCIFQPRKGDASVGYGDRAINLHNDHTGEEPDIIFVYLGCNDFAYFKDTFGTADSVEYETIILDNSDGTYTYAQPTNACEAYAIMLHKAEHRYPDAEIYCMTSTSRREVDYTGDTYPDAGQPTAYIAELQKIAKYFGYPVIDLENAIPKNVEIFDKYIGDKRAHANVLGMDQITNEVLSVMLDREAEICHVTADHGAVAEQAVLWGGSYNVKVNIPQGYSVTVTMGGKDVTSGTYKDGGIAIAEVTGDIHVATVINRDPQNFCWEFQNGILTSVGDSENVLTKLSGTVANNILNDGIFQLNTPVILKHDLHWAVEWKCAEDWRGVMLASHKESATKGMTFLSRVNGGQLCFGTYTGSQYDNYGIDISGLSSTNHTYRLENRIAADRSNMIWLYVDGEEIGPMNNYFIGSKDQNKTSNWVSGKDFVFSFIGMTGHALRNCQLDYLTVKECNHTYENGSCTGCGAENLNLVNYQGKVISILGDSISTFAGYIPTADGFNLEHLARYPQDNLLTDVNETWWMQVINRLDAKLGINDSWRGATVSGAKPVTSGTTGENACMANLTRIQNLGSNGTPDIILFYGGTNDLAHVDKIGSFDPATAPTVADLTTRKWDNLADGYVHTLLRLRHYYPEAQIICLLPTYTATYYSNEKLAQGNEILAAICQHYGIPYTDLRDSGANTSHLPDGIHPDAVGMDLITEAVLTVLTEQCQIQPGVNTVYSVRHELTNASASLGHYKGISSGNIFEEHITGTHLEVTVTMGGADITDTCYQDGRIRIETVSGDIVVTAKSVFSLGDRLQSLPELYYGINLWPLLKHDTDYYTATGWGTHSSGVVRSVTIPICPGDRLWATSFQASGSNGGTINGIRLTWFDKEGVLESVSADRVYAEFAQNGYLTAPDGAIAVNVVMWNDSTENELYIYPHEHSFKNSICVGCGCAFADIADLSGDGKITVFDAQLLMEALSGLRTLTTQQWQALGDLTPDDILDHILGRPCDD